MGGSLRFKVNENHDYMKRAINKLYKNKTKSEDEGLFNFTEGSSILRALNDNIPNYAYVHYSVRNNIYNPRYLSPKNEDSLIAYSKISDPNSPLNKYFVVSKPDGKRKYDTNLKVGSPRNIITPYPDFLGFGKPGGAWLRHKDTEAMLLEELSERFDKNTEAVVHLFSYLEPCLSCDHVIAKFLEEFQFIDMFIYYFEDSLTCKV